MPGQYECLKECL